MRCPFPVSIRNPQLDSFCQVAPDGVNFVTLAGEIIPPRIEVPCGRCTVCQSNRREEWASRMELESRTAAVTYFITLTYEDAFYPGELVVSDLQKFFKRLRYQVHCRYFACGEYGERFRRGHYHAVVWLQRPVSVDVFTRFIEKCWRFGFTQVRLADYNCFRYVAKYCIKFIQDAPSGMQKPFAIMSRRPGISFKYFESIKDFEHSYILLESGKRCKLPRYNLEKLEPVEQVSIKRERLKVAETMSQLSETELQLTAINFHRSLERKYLQKYGTAKK